MSQIQVLEEPSAATFVPTLPARRGRVPVPGWLRLLVSNPKSRGGLVVLTFMILVALFAPLIATHDPNAFSLFDAKQAPSWHHPFGTTDQGSDIFSQVVLGTRTSLMLGAAAAALAMSLATVLGILAAYAGGSSRTWIWDIVYAVRIRGSRTKLRMSIAKFATITHSANTSSSACVSG